MSRSETSGQHTPFCVACGKSSTVLLTGVDYGGTFTDAPHCDECAVEVGWSAGVEITKAVDLWSGSAALATARPARPTTRRDTR